VLEQVLVLGLVPGLVLVPGQHTRLQAG